MYQCIRGIKQTKQKKTNKQKKNEEETEMGWDESLQKKRCQKSSTKLNRLW